MAVTIYDATGSLLTFSQWRNAHKDSPLLKNESDEVIACRYKTYVATHQSVNNETKMRASNSRNAFRHGMK